MPRRLPAVSVVLVGVMWLASISSAGAPCVSRSGPVYFRVLVPKPDAELVIAEQPTRQTGPSRQFVTPPLEPGRAYRYTFQATWEANGYTTVIRTRTVTVQAGQQVEVDLRSPDPANPDRFVIVFIPTPDEVVDAMCKLAGIGKDDVVYDLGCGDGRMVITAVKYFGAKRGVGVDIDPERVKDSREAAEKAGVQNRLEFRQGDVLNINDLADASVVMLYMGEDVNLRLRPILLKTLKPGSRIVSHQFGMGDWKPLKSEKIFDSFNVGYDIHLWKIGDNGPDARQR